MGKRTGPPGAVVRRYESQAPPRNAVEAARSAVGASLAAIGASTVAFEVRPLYVEVRATHGRMVHMGVVPAAGLSEGQATLEAGAACIRAILAHQQRAA